MEFIVGGIYTMLVFLIGMAAGQMTSKKEDQ